MIKNLADLWTRLRFGPAPSDVVLGLWTSRLPAKRGDLHIPQFEKDTWENNLRLGASKFEHHQAIVRLIGPLVSPSEAD